jgi:hypothetical protein
MTVASRIMLPTYAIAYAILGLVYVLWPLEKLLSSPGLTYANGISSLRLWGWIFLAAAVLMAIALKIENRLLFRYALWLCIVCMGGWTAVFVFAAFAGTSSPAAPVLPALATVACFASDRSLLTREA